MFMPCGWVQIGCSVAKWSPCPNWSLALGGEGTVNCDDAGERLALSSRRTPKWSALAAPFLPYCRLVVLGPLTPVAGPSCIDVQL